jgi:4-amino-4-deoxy-L-arabinose transferase-like glycosyltransferase
MGRGPAVVIVLVWLAVGALGLGTTSLWEPDEPRFAEATRQMLLRGDVLTPYFNGAPRFEKPILFYWMQLPAFVVLSPSETAARLPSALAGLGCLLLTYAIGRRYFSKRAALSGTLVLATTFRFAMWTRMALTDMPVMFCTLAVLYCFLIALEDDPYRPRAALMGWIAVGLGALTKGPVIAIPLLILAVYIAWTRQRNAIGRLRIGVGLLLTAAIVLPWYVWMTWVYGRAFIDYAIGHEVIARYGYSSIPFPSQGRSLLWYPRIYLGDAAPWTLFILAAAAWAWSQRKTFDTQIARGLTLVVIWFAIVFLVFTPARFKLPHYILPAYPAAALLTGLFLDHAFRAQIPGRLWHVPVAVTSLCAVVLAGVLALLLHNGFGTPWLGLGMLLPSAIGAAGAAMLTLDLMGRRAAAFHAFIGGLASAIAIGAVYTAPHDLQPYLPIRALGQRVVSLAAPGDRVAIYGALGGTGLIFYGQHNIEWLDDPAAASSFFSGPGRRFCVIPERDFDLVRRIHHAPLSVLERGVLFTFRSKRLLQSKPLEERSLLLVSNEP